MPRLSRYYDYNEPETVPHHLHASVDYVLMDPPYLVSPLEGFPPVDPSPSLPVFSAPPPPLQSYIPRAACVSVGLSPGSRDVSLLADEWVHSWRLLCDWWDPSRVASFRRPTRPPAPSSACDDHSVVGAPPPIPPPPSDFSRTPLILIVFFRFIPPPFPPLLPPSSPLEKSDHCIIGVELPISKRTR